MSAGQSHGSLSALMIVLLVLVGLVPATIAVVFGIRAARRSSRVGAVSLIGDPAAAGWTTGPDDPALLANLDIGIVPGPSALARNVVWRQDPAALLVAASTTTTGWSNERGSTRITSRASGRGYTVCFAVLPYQLPRMTIVGEGRVDSLLTRASGTAVETEFWQFNSERVVAADDSAQGHGMLAPHVIATIHDGPAGATLQVCGNRLISFREVPPSMDEIVERSRWLLAVAEVIPDFLRSPLEG